MPYRDDDHVLESKKRELEQERARIEEHKRALAHLSEDEARNQRELAEIELRLSKRKKSLPLLGEIRIASPCNADWNAMTGDEQTRFCDKCSKNVYKISAMTTEQAESLIHQKEGKLCVRYYERADGTVMTADCPVGGRKKRNRRIAFVAAFGAAAGGALYYVNEYRRQHDAPEYGMECMLGLVEAAAKEAAAKEAAAKEAESKTSRPTALPESVSYAPAAKKNVSPKKPIQVKPATPVVKSTPVKAR